MDIWEIVTTDKVNEALAFEAAKQR